HWRQVLHFLILLSFLWVRMKPVGRSRGLLSVRIRQDTSCLSIPTCLDNSQTLHCLILVEGSSCTGTFSTREVLILHLCPQELISQQPDRVSSFYGKK